MTMCNNQQSQQAHQMQRPTPSPPARTASPTSSPPTKQPQANTSPSPASTSPSSQPADSPPTTIIPPHKIAHQFLDLYYKVATQHPSHLHKFYTPLSTLTHSPLTTTNNNSGNVINAAGSEAIDKSSADLPLHGKNVTINETFAQSTEGHGCLIVVNGTAVDDGDKGGESIGFVQTFVLCRMGEGRWDNFYCRNDVLFGVGAGVEKKVVQEDKKVSVGGEKKKEEEGKKVEVGKKVGVAVKENDKMGSKVQGKRSEDVKAKEVRILKREVKTAPQVPDKVEKVKSGNGAAAAAAAAAQSEVTNKSSEVLEKNGKKNKVKNGKPKTNGKNSVKEHVKKEVATQKVNAQTADPKTKKVTQPKAVPKVKKQDEAPQPVNGTKNAGNGVKTAAPAGKKQGTVSTTVQKESEKKQEVKKPKPTSWASIAAKKQSKPKNNNKSGSDKSSRGSSPSRVSATPSPPAGPIRPAQNTPTTRARPQPAAGQGHPRYNGTGRHYQSYSGYDRDRYGGRPLLGAMATERLRCSIMVTGHDTSKPQEEVVKLLRPIFEKVGGIVKVDVRPTRAFVEFTKPEDVTKAVRGFERNNLGLRVEEKRIGRWARGGGSGGGMGDGRRGGRGDGRGY